MSYSDLLKDPRWQRKRLEILERDQWMCQDCCDDTATLHVHHRYYAKGKKPWEYSNDALLTLCEACHAKTTDVLGEIQRIVGGLCLHNQVVALGFLLGAVAWTKDDVTFIVEDYETADGIAHAFDIQAEDVIDALSPDKSVTSAMLWSIRRQRRSLAAVHAAVAAL